MAKDAKGNTIANPPGKIGVQPHPKGWPKLITPQPPAKEWTPPKGSPK